MCDSPLETISDDDLHVAVRRLTARSNVALADLLAHLGEVEARGIHRERACASLYTYCMYELRMSEDAAYRRSKAARIIHRHPDLRDALARGEIHLTGLLMIAPLLGGEQRAEVLERARFRSKREIARLIAELDPKPAVPPLIEPIGPTLAGRPIAGVFAAALAGPVRCLAVGDRPADWTEPDDGRCREADAEGERASNELRRVVEAERSLESARNVADDVPRRERALQYRVQFTATQEYVDLLEEAFDLLGQGKRATGVPEVQLRALRELVERLRKQKRGAPRRQAAADRDDAPSAAPERELETDDARGAAPEPGADTDHAQGAAPERGSHPSHGRHIPAAVRGAVWARDVSRCAFVDARGVRCSEARGLEIHHREAHAFGGPATEQNLELRCRAHNLLAAERDFGREHMDWMRGCEVGDEASLMRCSEG